MSRLRNRKGRYAKPSARQRKLGTMPIEQFRARLPPQLRWMADMDYLDKLTEEERIWLLTVAETEYRGKAEAGDASPMSVEQQRKAAAYVRSQGSDRRPDLMNYNEEFPKRRQGVTEEQADGEIRVGREQEIYEAMGGKSAREVEDEMIEGIDNRRRKR